MAIMNVRSGQDENGSKLLKPSGGAARLPEHPRKLLIADDEHLVASGMSAALTELGYDVITATNGEEAIELCRHHRPDLALLDIRMGSVSGLEAAEVLFQEMTLPIIIFSAYSDEKYVESSTRIGVMNYLLKPVPKDQLRAAISVAWGRFLAWAEQNSEIEQLRYRLESRKIIEQAKWIIVKHKEVSEAEAMKMLQMQARNTRRPLVDVAQGVLEAQSLMGM